MQTKTKKKRKTIKMRKSKLVTLLSGVIALGLSVSTVFAAWAVTDNASPNGIRISLKQPDKTIYMKPGEWTGASAWFAAYAFNSPNQDAQFITMTVCENTDYYSVVIPGDYTDFLLSRQNPASEVASFKNQWNQSEDYTISDSYDLYTFASWDSGKDGKSTFNASKHSHTESAISHINVVAKTCDTDGSYDEVKHCTICQTQTYINHVVVPASHGEIITHNAVASTCTVQGHSTYYECPDCDKLFSDSACTQETTLAEVTLPLAAHTYSSWSYDATNHWHECTVCHAHLDTAAHSGGTATEEHGKVCEVCSHEYTDPLPHTHEYVHHDAVAANCTTAGNEEYYTCSKCTMIFNSSKVAIAQIPIIAALGHNMTEHAAHAATCTEAGNSLYYSCSHCNKYFSDEEGNTQIAENSWVISATGHSPSSTWSYNDTQHWHECEHSCGTKFDTANHIMNDNESCTACGYHDENIYYYLVIYNENSRISKTKLIQNPGNDNELMLTDVSITKGYKAQIMKSGGNLLGVSNSYSHNLTQPATTGNGFVNSEGYYIACQTGTFDFYIKFNESAHTTFSSVYVNVDDTRILYIQNNWSKNGLQAQYWGDNVTGGAAKFSNLEFYKNTGNPSHPTYKMVIPKNTSKAQFKYTENSNVIYTVEITLGTTDVIYYYDQWNDGTPTVGSFAVE